MTDGTGAHDERRWRQNDPPLLIMLSLAGGDKHGHALAGDIQEMSGVRLGPGTLFPFTTYKVLPSALRLRLLGYHPVGTRPFT